MVSRRDFARMVAGTGALALLGQMGRTTAMATPGSSYRAMVGVFLFGGNDSWNMVIPTDALHAGYYASRGSVGIPLSALTPLSGASFALHPAMAPLNTLWDQGALSVVLNTGTLFAPLTKATYRSRPDLVPTNLMSHSDEQDHWQGLRARGDSADGFLGRLADRMGGGTLSPLVSLAGSQLALIGRQSNALVLPSTGTLGRSGYSTSSSAANQAKNAAIDAFATAGGTGDVTETIASEIQRAYGDAATANGILTAASSVDSWFVNPSTGAALTSDVARQLMRVARVIEARGTLGHMRQAFFVSQGGYDNHSGQVSGTARNTGTHAALLADLSLALAAFYRAMQALGVERNVTAFTMSDFARTYQGNAQNGTDHAWGANHLVVGGDLSPGRIFGSYPDPVLGGADDISNQGRFVPTIAQEEYLGAIARWHGVSDADLPYVFPNWASWNGGGRGPLSLFQV